MLMYAEDAAARAVLRGDRFDDTAAPLGQEQMARTASGL
jgi:hypothetical protein